MMRCYAVSQEAWKMKKNVDYSFEIQILTFKSYTLNQLTMVGWNIDRKQVYLPTICLKECLPCYKAKSQLS